MNKIQRFSVIVIMLFISLHSNPLKSIVKDSNQVNGSWECWSDGTPNPCHHYLNYVKMRSSTDGWAVGYKGIILRWNGIDWLEYPSPISQTLNSVFPVSSTDAWAVGNGGSILRWDGTLWTSYLSPSNHTLNELSFISSDNGWAVGDQGTILHWNGSNWSVVSSPTSNAINSIEILDSSNGWAVGNAGTILHWNGSSWSTYTSPTNLNLYDIDMYSTNEGWAVGNVYLHWDGNAWSVNASTFYTIWGVSILSPTDVWAVESFGSIYHWDGVKWNYVSGTGGLSYLSLDMVSSNEGWAVGDGGIITFYNGATWTIIYDNNGILQLNSISMTSANNGWSGGVDGVLLKWDGEKWISFQSPTNETIQAIDMLAPDNGWMVGADIFHWDGNNWNADPNTGYSLSGIDMLSPTDGWAVGDPGIFHWDGNTWNSVTNPITYPNFTVIEMISTDDGWIINRGENLLHWDGSDWSEVTIPSSNKFLEDISMLSSTNGWAVGGGGTILHWDGSQWSQVTSPITGTEYLSSIDMVSDDDGWIGTDYGKILHWDGVSWNLYSQTKADTINSIDMVSPNEGWAVGLYGTILHFTNSTPPQAQFSASENFGVAPLTVAFTNLTAGDFNSSLWDFGDGSTSSELSPTHVYSDTGTYTITLSVNGPGGSDFERKAEYIHVVDGVQASITPENGGMLVYTSTTHVVTIIQIPSDAVTQTEQLIYQPIETITKTNTTELLFAHIGFNLNFYLNGSPLEGFIFQKPVTVTIQYNDEDVIGLDEHALALLYFDGEKWVDASCGLYNRQPSQNYLSVPICHLSQFGLFGNERHTLYLPITIHINWFK
jgi:PKD repeat protein